MWFKRNPTLKTIARQEAEILDLRLKELDKKHKEEHRKEIEMTKKPNLKNYISIVGNLERALSCVEEGFLYCNIDIGQTNAELIPVKIKLDNYSEAEFFLSNPYCQLQGQLKNSNYLGKKTLYVNVKTVDILTDYHKF